MSRIARLAIALRRSSGRSASSNKRKLLVDISVLSRNDAGTGIQRVVNALLKELSMCTSEDYEVCPIAATRSTVFQYVKRSPDDTLFSASRILFGGRVIPTAGDIFLGLDLSAHILPAHGKTLAKWKRQGVQFHFMVYDLLPLTRPEWFSDAMASHFRKWLRTISQLADSLLCISKHVRSEVIRWLKTSHPDRFGAIAVHHIVMGSDAAEPRPVSDMGVRLLEQLQAEHCALLVGTVEPRKGHAVVLAAFETLWADPIDSDFHFVIAGRSGWKTEAFQAHLCNHREFGKRLHWLDNVDDVLLNALYEVSSGVIAASFDEGYGLPIIEASRHRKPVLARDIAVFRELASHVTMFFDNDEPQHLANDIRRFLSTVHDMTQPVAWASWKQAADMIMHFVGLCEKPGDRARIDGDKKRR